VPSRLALLKITPDGALDPHQWQWVASIHQPAVWSGTRTSITLYLP
jgi:hypothetical protein